MDMPQENAQFEELSEVKTEFVQIEISNPLLLRQNLIPFDQIKPEHFIPAFETLAHQIEPQLLKIENHPNPSWKTVLMPLEAIEENIHQTIGPMIHLKMVMDSYDLRLAWAQVEPLWTDLMLRIKQSPSLFLAYKKIKESEEWDSLIPAQKRVLEGRLLQAELSGIGLDLSLIHI